MNKIIVLIGTSGSGKSTWSNNYVNTYKNTVIVSRDAIRMSLFGLSDSTYHEYYESDVSVVKEREAIVSKFFDNQIWYALQKGYDVIADNTHLQVSYINHYKMFGVKVELRVFEVPVDICISRDAQRDKYVGSSVIVKQFDSYRSLMKKNFREDIQKFNEELEEIYNSCKKMPYDKGKKDAYIVDIDGTLAIKGDRDIHDMSKVYLDSVNFPVDIAVYSIDNLSRHIVICSGRDESGRKGTEDWLELHGVPYDKLYMRKEKDNRKDWIVKAEMWREIQKDYNIIAMIDDRDQVVRFARNMGFDVFQVNYGDF